MYFNATILIIMMMMMMMYFAAESILSCACLHLLKAIHNGQLLSVRGHS